jgi:hypothetical protein
MNKINKKIPLTLDRMLYLICYNWGICTEVEEIITKLGFWGDWRPSLLECPRLNFANECVTKLKRMRHYQPANHPLFNQHNYEGYTPIYSPLLYGCYFPFDASLPPSTAPHLDKITISKENLTRSDIIEIKKYYLARVFTARYSAFRAVDVPCKIIDYRKKIKIIKKPYKKLCIKTFNSEVVRYCATNYW